MAIHLARRSGAKPETSVEIPHRQLDQNAPVELQERLWDRMRGLPGVETGQSLISVPGARAIFACDDGVASVCPDCVMKGLEFAHIHPAQDGSLHACLPEHARVEAIEKGWAEPHPWVALGRIAASNVMLYGPRDEAELEVVWSLVRASHEYATGLPELVG
ncbi:luciferase family protein [Oricola indica]|jgi:hypothetical protein|uniref:luciferase domain-containing protein n=1 Tax=Oricola indica TaxID=2872591 RepID=UPI001CBDC504|nr:luciferase family protein [Oricola indica]